MASAVKYWNTVEQIQAAFDRMPPGERKQLTEYVKFNTEYNGLAGKVVQVWRLAVLSLVREGPGDTRRMVYGSWSLGGASLGRTASGDVWEPKKADIPKGITANEMRKIVGLKPVKERKPIPVSKTNPKALPSRARR